MLQARGRRRKRLMQKPESNIVPAPGTRLPHPLPH
eukprot:COSAG01_NODE_12900_length_1667_cov_2.146684_2_plen_34_part_01